MGPGPAAGPHPTAAKPDRARGRMTNRRAVGIGCISDGFVLPVGLLRGLRRTLCVCSRVWCLTRPMAPAVSIASVNFPSSGRFLPGGSLGLCQREPIRPSLSGSNPTQLPLRRSPKELVGSTVLADLSGDSSFRGTCQMHLGLASNPSTCSSCWMSPAPCWSPESRSDRLRVFSRAHSSSRIV